MNFFSSYWAHHEIVTVGDVQPWNDIQGLGLLFFGIVSILNCILM